MATGLDFGVKAGPFTCRGCGAGVSSRDGDHRCPACARGQVNAAPIYPHHTPAPLWPDNGPPKIAVPGHP